MAPIAERLGELGGFPVTQLPAVVGEEVEAAVAAAAPGDVLLLENTRYEPGETKNDPVLAAGLGRLGDFFVLDAFGTAHRAHASTVGVTEHVKSVAGPLLAAEVEALDALLRNPARPYVVVLGGAKVSDKLGVMKALLPRVDVMLVGGGMCFTLLAAEGYDVGDSLLEEDMIDEVRDLLNSEWGSRVTLPSDIVVADRFAEDAAAQVVSATDMPVERPWPRHRARHGRPVLLGHHRRRARCSGTDRWACSSGRPSGPGPRRWPGRSPRRAPSPWPVAAIRWPPFAPSVSTIRFRTSAPAGEPASNSWKETRSRVSSH